MSRAALVDLDIPPAPAPEARARWEILDCTIRDGGLMNNHHFEDKIVKVVYDTCIAAGVAYNTGRIAWAERARELATLRVIGLSSARCPTGHPRSRPATR